MNRTYKLTKTRIKINLARMTQYVQSTCRPNQVLVQSLKQNELLCAICVKPIVVGEYCVSNSLISKTSTKCRTLYKHQSCWEKTFH